MSNLPPSGEGPHGRPALTADPTVGYKSRSVERTSLEQGGLASQERASDNCTVAMDEAPLFLGGKGQGQLYKLKGCRNPE